MLANNYPSEQHQHMLCLSPHDKSPICPTYTLTFYVVSTADRNIRLLKSKNFDHQKVANVVSVTSGAEQVV